MDAPDAGRVSPPRTPPPTNGVDFWVRKGRKWPESAEMPEPEIPGLETQRNARNDRNDRKLAEMTENGRNDRKWQKSPETAGTGLPERHTPTQRRQSRRCIGVWRFSDISDFLVKI